MDNHTPEVLLKQCSKKDKCINPLGSWLPATSEYFSRQKDTRDGWRSLCKTCDHESKRRYYEGNSERLREGQRRWRTANTEKVRENKRRYRVNNPEKVREQKRRYYEANVEKISEYKRQWAEVNTEKISEYKRQWYEANQEKLRERSRQWHKANRERALESRRRWRVANPEILRERKRRYYEANREQSMAAAERRRARKLSLPDTFTVSDWHNSLKYFHSTCAYCGAQQSFWSVLHADHFIPLSSSDCPGTLSSNIVPACRGCNNNKFNHDPIEWVTRKFGKRKAKQILARIQTYFEWIKSNS